MATPDESQRLVAAVPAVDRAAWALAWYGGLRLGEIRALDWANVDLEAGEIHVRAAWCNRTKQVTPPKTAKARRIVPIVGELRRVLLEHAMLTGRRTGRVVERAGGGVESGDSLAWRAEQAWKAAGLARYTMHEARHTYASLMILPECRSPRSHGSLGIPRSPSPSTATATCTRWSVSCGGGVRFANGG